MRLFGEVIEAVRDYPVKDLVVAAAEDHTVLEAVAEAVQQKMVRAKLASIACAVYMAGVVRELRLKVGRVRY